MKYLSFIWTVSDLTVTQLMSQLPHSKVVPCQSNCCLLHIWSVRSDRTAQKLFACCLNWCCCFHKPPMWKPEHWLKTSQWEWFAGAGPSAAAENLFRCHDFSPPENSNSPKVAMLSFLQPFWAQKLQCCHLPPVGVFGGERRRPEYLTCTSLLRVLRREIISCCFSLRHHQEQIIGLFFFFFY